MGFSSFFFFKFQDDYHETKDFMWGYIRLLDYKYPINLKYCLWHTVRIL